MFFRSAACLLRRCMSRTLASATVARIFSRSCQLSSGGGGAAVSGAISSWDGRPRALFRRTEFARGSCPWGSPSAPVLLRRTEFARESWTGASSSANSVVPVLWRRTERDRLEAFLVRLFFGRLESPPSSAPRSPADAKTLMFTLLFGRPPSSPLASVCCDIGGEVSRPGSSDFWDFKLPSRRNDLALVMLALLRSAEGGASGCTVSS
mmetsp:Transcript_13009/g.41085  ORF Transcript_13009/g.41085 Transcript_13009/m.41085 type:complete len:208 (-) Transcript_13009:1629-2252(-)